jgi:excinuclease ABC subunit C
VRDGKLTGREIHHLDAEEGAAKKEIISAFLKQFYTNQTLFPKEIILEEKIDDMTAIEEWLSNEAAHRIKLTVPARGDKAALLKLAQKDISETEALAREMLAARKAKEAKAEQALREITGLRSSSKDGSLPRGLRPHLRIEAYDVSHTGGEDSVGAMVVFRGMEKSSKDYRRFKIRTVDDDGKSLDDYASLQEVLYRRLKRGLAGDKSFDELPDVILIDGGKGHVAAAAQIIEALGLDPPIPVLGMVKDDRHRTRGLVSRKDMKEKETDLTQMPELYHLIGAIQEEVHRFAIDYHRGVRNKNLFSK